MRRILNFLFILSVSVYGQDCPPKPSTIASFNLNQYIGTWYEIEGLPTYFTPSGTKCISATYTSKEDSTIGVRNTCLLSTGGFSEACGTANVPDPSKPGELFVQFNPNGGSTSMANYLILDTDYRNYASIYSCYSVMGSKKVEMAWILSRNTTMELEFLTKAKSAFINQGISVNGFEIINQNSSECIYSNPNGPSC